MEPKEIPMFEPTLEDTDQSINLHIFAAQIAARCSKREIAFWGDHRSLRELLKEKYGLAVTRIFPSKEPEELKKLVGKQNRFYLVVPILPYSAQTQADIDAIGYEEGTDYLRRFHRPVTIENAKDGYTDIYGNRVIGSLAHCKVVFKGYNSAVRIGANCRTTGLTIIIAQNDCEVTIGENGRFVGQQHWMLFGSCGKLHIGNKADIRDDATIALFTASTITIGDEAMLMAALTLKAHAGTEIHVGAKCMFARECVLMAGDGHSIFDVNTGKNINSVARELPEHKRKIIVGEHVWMGQRVFVLAGTNIRDGSIVGALSLVNRSFPNNCILAGSPAKLIRRDVTWSGCNALEDMERCDPDYIHCTED